MGGGGVTPPKNGVTWGGGVGRGWLVSNFLLERGDKPEKGGGSWCRNGGRVATFLLLYSLITFNVCEGKVRFPLSPFPSSVFRVNHARFLYNSLLYWNLVSFVHFWSILVVCKKCWLVHLCWHAQARCFLDKWGPTLNTLPYCFSSNFSDRGVTFLLNFNLRNMIKQSWHYIYSSKSFEAMVYSLIKVFPSFSSFTPHVGPTCNIYLSHYCAKFE